MASVRQIACLLPLFGAQALASCAYGTFLQPRAEAGVEVNTFGYTGNIGPFNWAALDAAGANSLCSSGTRQSPIDMTTGAFNVIPGATLALQIADMSEGAEFENLGTTVEVLAEGTGSITLGGTAFTLQQFHFHLPSEHLDNGTSMAMEMHMVFQSEQQQIAVIGTYIDIDTGAAVTPPAAEAPPAEAPVAEAPVAEAPAAVERRGRAKAARREKARSQAEKRQTPPPMMVTTPNESTAAVPSSMLETLFSSVGEISTPGSAVRTQPLSMAEVVSTLSSGSFQSYMGSLTTPPCSEGVQWLVSTQKLAIQPASFLAARDVIGFNSRFTQNSPGQPNILSFATQ